MRQWWAFFARIVASSSKRASQFGTRFAALRPGRKRLAGRVSPGHLRRVVDKLPGLQPGRRLEHLDRVLQPACFRRVKVPALRVGKLARIKSMFQSVEIARLSPFLAGWLSSPRMRAARIVFARRLVRCESREKTLGECPR